MRTGGFRDANMACDPKQAGGSCGTPRVHDVMVDVSRAGGVLNGASSDDLGDVINGMMVKRVFRAKRRKFKAKQMQTTRGVHAWRKTSPDVMRHLLALVQCVSVIADVPLCRKSSVHVRSELRKRLAASLAMMEAYPNLQDIDYGARPVQSGINSQL